MLTQVDMQSSFVMAFEVNEYPLSARPEVASVRQPVATHPVGSDTMGYKDGLFQSCNVLEPPQFSLVLLAHAIPHWMGSRRVVLLEPLCIVLPQ